MVTPRRIGILTSGGDAPGMNACILAAVRKAKKYGIEVMGIRGGYSGLISGDIVQVNTHDYPDMVSRGGTILYSDRCPEFKTPEGMRKALDTCKKFNIDAIIAIGGDGTFRGATDLTKHGIPTIGLPGTIDNDITASDYTIGFDTAMNTAVRMIDALQDTCESHARINVVELMGRECGDITLNCAIASAAVASVVREVPFDEEAIIEKIKQERASGKRSMIIAVSEGVNAPDGRKYGEYLQEKIQNETGIETRFARFAHVVRGGSPTLRDRVTAYRMGDFAVDLLLEGKSNLVVCEVDGRLTPIDINFSLIVDRMYKNKLKPGDTDAFTAEQRADMEAICEKRRAEDILVSDLVNQN